MTIQSRIEDKPQGSDKLAAPHVTARTNPDETRHDWTRDELQALWDLPFNDLVFEAQIVHRRWFKSHEVQMSTLLSIKTGGCPEDCGYCAQSSKFDTGLKASKLIEVEKVLAEARRAKQAGATRYCMGAAWRAPKDRDMDAVCAMVEGIKDMGMETCMTLGMLSGQQVHRLAQSGLDYYNHNIDTSEEYYPKVITTRTFQDRLDTLERVRNAGINVCSGGIVGMGESQSDRLGMLMALANLPEHPQSVPINMLMPMEGTPLGMSEKVDPIDFVRMIAVARIIMPQSVVRLAAGRELMSDEQQALCFMAGANSIFVGEKLLTAKNPEADKDQVLLKKLGITSMPAHSCPSEKHVGQKTSA